MAYLVSHPDEVKVVSKRFGMGATNLDRYLELDGYKALQKAIGMGPDAIINEMKASNLRGRGGAGFPAGLKWSFVPKQSPKPKYVLCNGDESEPGTCKDRLIFEHDPHSVIEGVMIAAIAVGAKTGFIYLRGEYRYLIQIMEKAVADAYARGIHRQEHFRLGYRSRCLRALRRGRLRSRRRVGADGVAGRQARCAAHPASLPCGRGIVGRPDGHQQRRDSGQRAAHHPWAAGSGLPISGRRRTAARTWSASAATWKGPVCTNFPWATT